jgi:hypothetical protein
MGPIAFQVWLKMVEIKLFQGLWRYRYKYKSPDGHHHILAYYVRRYADDNDKEGKSVVDWSLYHDDDNGNTHNNEQPLLEQTNTTFEDFHNMLDSYGWEKEGYEVVVCQ